MDTNIGLASVDNVEHGEKSPPRNDATFKQIKNTKNKWSIFLRRIWIWVIIAFISYISLIIVLSSKLEKSISFIDFIKEIFELPDTLNISYSLMLSAFVEQLMHYSNNKKQGIEDFLLGTKGLLTLLGGLMFIAYSINTFPESLLISNICSMNVIYTVFSSVIIILGFWPNTINEGD